MSTTKDDTAVSAAESTKRYFELLDLLRYTFKPFSAFNSQKVWVKTPGKFWQKRVRIQPIAHRGEYFISGGGGVATGMGGVRTFVWMTDSGHAVIRVNGHFEFSTIRALASSLSDHEYKLLTLWLSNSGDEAIKLINDRHEAQLREMANL